MVTRRSTGWRERQAEMRAQARAMRNAALDAEMGVTQPVPVSGMGAEEEGGELSDTYTPPSWYREDVDYFVRRTPGLRSHEVAVRWGLRSYLSNVILLDRPSDTVTPRGMRPYAVLGYTADRAAIERGPVTTDIAAEQRMLASDFSALEQRVVAHMAHDPATIDAIRTAAMRALGEEDRGPAAVAAAQSAMRGLTATGRTPLQPQPYTAAEILEEARHALDRSLTRGESPVAQAARAARATRVRRRNEVTGDVAEVRVFDRSLADEELALLRSGVNPPGPVIAEIARPSPNDPGFKWSERMRMTGLPKEGNIVWMRIAKKGCVGARDSVGEFGCDFAWGCAKCPVTVEKGRQEKANAPTKLDRFTLRKGRSNG